MQKLDPVLALFGSAEWAAGSDHGWTGCQPGSWVRVRSRGMSRSHGGVEHVMITEVKKTLVEIGADGWTFAVETTVTLEDDGNLVKQCPTETRTDKILPALLAFEKIAFMDPLETYAKKLTAEEKAELERSGELTRGEEDLGIAGKQVRCRWRKSITSTFGKGTTGTWTSADVPGFRVKEVVTSQHGEAGQEDVFEQTTEVVDFEARR